MYGSQQSGPLSGSVESQDEMEGPRASSPASSKSSPSEMSTVSYLYPCTDFDCDIRRHISKCRILIKVFFCIVEV